jgi:hypothetical protein
MRKKTPNKTGPSQAVVDMDRLPRRFRPEFDPDPDGRWLAVIKTGREIITASGDTPDEAAGHALELVLSVLEESSLPEYLASVEVEDEEITPETAAAIDPARASFDRGEGISHDDILREFGPKK